jgi:hypothetical protein
MELFYNIKRRDKVYGMEIDLVCSLFNTKRVVNLELGSYLSSIYHHAFIRPYLLKVDERANWYGFGGITITDRDANVLISFDEGEITKEKFINFIVSIYNSEGKEFGDDVIKSFMNNSMLY